jgi:C-terminal processing protease CtpA/Prc
MNRIIVGDDERIAAIQAAAHTLAGLRRSRRRKAVGVVLISAALAACSGTSESVTAASGRSSATTFPSTSSGSPSTTTTLARPGSPVAVLNEIVDLIEARAYYGGRFDAQAWRHRIAFSAAHHTISSSDFQQIVGMILHDLGDHHSSYFTVDQAKAVRRADVLSTDTPSGKLLANHVGYLQLPSATGLLGSPAYATYVAAAQHVLSQSACGWIVDLRGNPGGSAYAMVGAVAPLIGPGTFLGFLRRDRTIDAYTITDSGLIERDVAHLDSIPSPTPAMRNALNTAPVAVLTDGETASAAEAVEVAFIGRAQTRSFGSPTYGIPTGNELRDLSDGSALNLTEEISLDRLGHTHDAPLAPDVAVPAIGTTDAVLGAAQAWLEREPACADTPTTSG